MAVRIYEGDQPYLFISYAHKDSERVMPILAALEGLGYRLWYDAGIEVGTEWPEYIADHLNRASCMLAFISTSFVESQNCRREINFAIDLKKEPYVIYLDDFELSLGMRMQLGTLQALPYYLHETFDSFIGALTRAKELAICRELREGMEEEGAARTLESLLEAGAFDAVLSFCKGTLASSKESAAIYRAMLFAELQIKNEEGLGTVDVDYRQLESYQAFLSLTDTETKARYQRYAEDAAKRADVKAKQQSTDKKHTMLQKQEKNTAALLKAQYADKNRLEIFIAGEEKKRELHGDLKSVRMASVWVLIMAAVNLVTFIASMFMGDELGGAIGMWLITGLAYYALSFIHLNILKKPWYFIFFTVFGAGVFSWVYAIRMLIRGKEIASTETLLRQKRKEYDALCQKIAKNEIFLTELRRELAKF
ncbi:MAG: toll/interleukin-1 receptor domain-containing protein [Clostridia bacterium]|nr:toll/interleukin-1 receptor domain-containing protein [Clostridia bacterium]